MIMLRKTPLGGCGEAEGVLSLLLPWCMIKDHEMNQVMLDDGLRVANTKY